MEKLIIKPRKKPAILAMTALAIITFLLGWLYKEAAHDTGAALPLILFWISLALLLAVAIGMLRTRLVFTNESIRSISSAFSKEKTYRWKDVKCCQKAGNNYNLYTKDNHWIGAIDVRNTQCQAVLEYLHFKKINIQYEKSSD